MKLRILLSALSLSIAGIALGDSPVDEGKTIFTSRCASCHNVNKTIVGPALAGVDERRNIAWIVKFVQSSQTLIKSGDKDAKELFAKFNNIPMPDHKDLDEAEIKSIVDYIKSQSSASTKKTTVFRPEKVRPLYVPISAKNYWVFAALGFCIGLLVLSLLFLVKVKEYQRKLARENNL